MWLLWSDNVLYLYVIFHREGSQHKLQITAVPQGQAGNPAHAAGKGGGFVQGHLSELCSPGETRVSIPCVWRTYPESPGFVRLSLPKVTGCDGWDLGLESGTVMLCSRQGVFVHPVPHRCCSHQAAPSCLLHPWVSPVHPGQHPPSPGWAWGKLSPFPAGCTGCFWGGDGWA